MKINAYLSLTSAAFMILTTATPSAFSADAKMLPGSICQTAYASDAKHVYRSGGHITNMSSNPIWIECPVVKDRDQHSSALTKASVWVIDKNPGTHSKDVVCIVSQHYTHLANPYHNSLSESARTWGLSYAPYESPKPQELKFDLNSSGTYRNYSILRCSLPPLTSNGERSSVISYQVFEY